MGEGEGAAEEGRVEQAGYLTASLASSFSVVLLRSQRDPPLGSPGSMHKLTTVLVITPFLPLFRIGRPAVHPRFLESKTQGIDADLFAIELIRRRSELTDGCIGEQTLRWLLQRILRHGGDVRGGQTNQKRIIAKPPFAPRANH